MGKKNRRSLLRTARFENFEERLALSAQPLAALTPDEAPVVKPFGEVAPVEHFSPPTIDPVKLEASQSPLAEAPMLSHLGQADFQLSASPVEQAGGDIDPLLNAAHAATGVNDVYNDYGFTGATQTIAVIDSGVDYLHGSLGGGFGSDYRVVGGWDFAEGDADPYDDGPAGFHGTHVAGIAASDHASFRGVTPEADVVALRVFDDAGAGYFSWVESALQWVHDNRNSFDNPITTVNLSLGAEWNSDSIPAWANLEDEFAQLEADGIFISVAAGNSFSSYNTAGLAYPAVSPYVVPVSSVDSSGSLSSFSQRHERVLAAPGSSITSTVPDHVFGADGNHNDFGNASGTSMAAPYVAGASMLVREAMEFAGQSNITQDMIYDHLRNTADMVFDSATNASYHSINVSAAIDALMPTDDYGSSSGTAHNLGSIVTTADLSGSISRLDDADYFTFTAGATGEVTFTATESFNFDSSWQLVGGDSSTADSFTFDVVSGESYTIALSTNDGVGHYSLNAELTATATDWGQVESMQHNDIAFASDQSLYQIQASRTGQLTVESFFSHAAGDVNLELLNAGNVVVASSNSTTDNERLDVAVNQGDVLTLRVNGQNADVDFRLTNLVAFDGTSVTVNGTSGDDSFLFDAADTTVTVNDVQYDVSGMTSFTFTGDAGANSIRSVGTNASTTITAGNGSLTLSDSTYTLTAASVQTVDVNADGGTADLQGTAGDDSFTASPTTATLSGGGYTLIATGFNQVDAEGNGGNDTATLNDSSGDDAFYGRTAYSYLMGTGYLNQAIGFDEVNAHASTGNDTAKLFDSLEADTFCGRETYSYMTGSGFLNVANGFDQVDAYSSGGDDQANLFDSAGDNMFVGRETYSYLGGDNFLNVAHGFAQVDARATTGNDTAKLYDSAGDESFYGRESYSYMMGDAFLNVAHNFDQVDAYSSGGNDTAKLYDGAGDDFFYGREDYSYMMGDGFLNVAHDFQQVDGYSSGGNDTAKLYDSAGDEYFYGREAYSYMMGDGFLNIAHDFEQVDGYASSGNDTAKLYDSAGDEAFYGREAYSYMMGSGFLNVAHDFDQVDAYASTGNDTAKLYDSAGDEQFYGRQAYSYVIGSGFLNVAHGFNQVDAYASSGNDTAKLYDTAGSEDFYGRPTYAYVLGSDFLNIANNFDQVDAYSSGGGDRAYFFDSASDDQFYGRSTYSYMISSSFLNVAWGFSQVTARAESGGNDQAILTGSTGADSLLRTNLYTQFSGDTFSNRVEDFSSIQASGSGGADQAVFDDLVNGDALFGRDNYIRLTDSDGDVLTAYDFSDVDANSDVGGSPDSDIESVDYLFEQLGDWS